MFLKHFGSPFSQHTHKAIFGLYKPCKVIVTMQWMTYATSIALTGLGNPFLLLCSFSAILVHLSSRSSSTLFVASSLSVSSPGFSGLRCGTDFLTSDEESPLAGIVIASALLTGLTYWYSLAIHNPLFLVSRKHVK